MVGEIINAKERTANLAQILNREAEHRIEHKQRMNENAFMPVRFRKLGIEIEWIVIERYRGEVGIVGFVYRPAPVVLELLANLEILKEIAARHEDCVFFQSLNLICHQDQPDISLRLIHQKRLDPKDANAAVESILNRFEILYITYVMEDVNMKGRIKM